jgi:hypothetical protein
MSTTNPLPGTTKIRELDAYLPNTWSTWQTPAESLWRPLTLKQLDPELLGTPIGSDPFTGATSEGLSSDVYDLYTGYQITSYRSAGGDWNVIVASSYGGEPWQDQFYAFLTTEGMAVPCTYGPVNGAYTWWREATVLGSAAGTKGDYRWQNNPEAQTAFGNWRKYSYLSRYWGYTQGPYGDTDPVTDPLWTMSSWGIDYWTSAYGVIDNGNDVAWTAQKGFGWVSSGVLWQDSQGLLNPFSFGKARSTDSTFQADVSVSRFGEETLAEAYQDIRPEVLLPSLTTTDTTFLPTAKDSTLDPEWSLPGSDGFTDFFGGYRGQRPRYVKYRDAAVEVSDYRMVFRIRKSGTGKTESGPVDFGQSERFSAYIKNSSDNVYPGYESWTHGAHLFDISLVFASDSAGSGYANGITGAEFSDVSASLREENAEWLTYVITGLNPISLKSGNYLGIQIVPYNMLNLPGFITDIGRGSEDYSGGFVAQSHLTWSIRWETLVTFPEFAYVIPAVYVEPPLPPLVPAGIPVWHLAWGSQVVI